MFDPVSGNVFICDNDNVGINRQSRCQVWGTMEYMAPEVIRGDADPSIQTDLYSLSVLLFYLWVWHHPLHGEMEYRFHCWDIPAKKKVYGESPVFIFDPLDRANHLPADPDYETARERWDWCPDELKAAFIRAFTEGLHKPERRVTEGEWQNLFSQIKDRIIACQKCRAENFLAPEASAASTCWHCSSAIVSPPGLHIVRTGGESFVPLSLGTTLRRRHVFPPSGNDDGSAVIGEVVRHPSIPGAAGIRNRSSFTWHAEFPDGSIADVPPGRALPLNPGTTITIEEAVATIGSRGDPV